MDPSCRVGILVAERKFVPNGRNHIPKDICRHRRSIPGADVPILKRMMHRRTMFVAYY